MKNYLLTPIAFFVVCGSLSYAQSPILWGDIGSDIMRSNDTGAFIYVYNLGSVPHDGRTPGGNLLRASNGILYGLTEQGGDNAAGTLFSYDIATNTETVLHSFGDTGCYAPADCPDGTF